MPPVPVKFIYSFTASLLHTKGGGMKGSAVKSVWLRILFAMFRSIFPRASA
ncbi:hypothetical protein D3C77_683920 [compost metagenome]